MSGTDCTGARAGMRSIAVAGTSEIWLSNPNAPHSLQ